MSSLLRQSWVALRLLLAMTLITGLLYPLGIWVVGRAVADRADGSLVTAADGQVVGSSLIGQAVPDGPEGLRWFQPRPSAAGDGYDAMASGGSNLAADNPALLALVAERRTAVAEREGVDPAAVPPDALLASASGLDPDISPEYARLQVARVARERGLPVDVVRRLVDEAVQQPTLGVIGRPRVNVLELNLALQRLATG